jgi:cytosine/adenosine deaminase-related metal-dependent hydrolase
MDLIVRHARLRRPRDRRRRAAHHAVLRRAPHPSRQALTADRARENTTNFFEDSIALMREVKCGYTVEDVAARATEVIHWLVGHGVTFVRSYMDVDTIAGLTALDGVLAARERCRRLATWS